MIPAERVYGPSGAGFDHVDMRIEMDRGTGAAALPPPRATTFQRMDSGPYRARPPLSAEELRRKSVRAEAPGDDQFAAGSVVLARRVESSRMPDKVAGLSSHHGLHSGAPSIRARSASRPDPIPVHGTFTFVGFRTAPRLTRSAGRIQARSVITPPAPLAARGGRRAVHQGASARSQAWLDIKGSGNAAGSQRII